MRGDHLTDNIKSIFEQNIRLLGETDKAVYYFREQQYDKALVIFADAIDQLNYVIEAIIKDRAYFNLVSTESVLEMLSGILEAKKNKDFILLADLLDLQLISFLCGVQELIISKEEILFDEDNYCENIKILIKKGIGFPIMLLEPMNSSKLMENGYRVEFTSCGLMTLAAQNEDTEFYFHTNSRVQSEAFILAKHWLSEDKKKYILYGFGMGYHIRQLQELAPEADIEVYEADLNVIQLACAFADVRDILENVHTKIIYDPGLKLLGSRTADLQPEEAVLIHYPSLRNIRDSEAHEKLETLIPWSKVLKSC